MQYVTTLLRVSLDIRCATSDSQISYGNHTKMKAYKLIPEDAASLFDYNPKTGLIVWKNGKDTASTKDRHGYIVVSLGRNNAVKGHRLAWFLFYGEQPEMDIDHINGDKSDNRINNLRLVSKSENMQNQYSARKDAPTQYIGVGATGRKSKPFSAQIKKDGKKTFLGNFENAEDAHKAYMEAKSKLHIK